MACAFPHKLPPQPPNGIYLGPIVMIIRAHSVPASVILRSLGYETNDTPLPRPVTSRCVSPDLPNEAHPKRRGPLNQLTA